MTRFSAFAVHLGISFVIFIVLAWLVIFEWYPGVLFDTDGGWRGMRIIFAVDLVLGPMLTLAVFKPGKPGLKTDLTLIGLLQTVCLIAGTYVVWSEKPEAVIYVDGRIQVVTRDDFVENRLPGIPDLSHIPGDDPKWVMVEVPTEFDELARFRADIVKREVTPIAEVDRYIPFSPDHPQFKNEPRNLGRYAEEPRFQVALKRFEAEYGDPNAYDFYLFTTRYVYTYAAFDRESGEMIGLLDLPRIGEVSEDDLSED